MVPRRGHVLEQIPSVMTDWDSWRTKHPKSKVLWMSRTSRDYTVDFYRKPEQFVIGLVPENGKPIAWPLDRLIKNPVRNESVGDNPVVVSFDARTVTARLFSREIGEQVLTFSLHDNHLVDQETRSRWDVVSGKCVDGHFRGKHLEALPAFLSYKRVWKNFYPDSEVRD